jgi:hypothetical protein
MGCLAHCLRFVSGLQASPDIPEMALCNVSSNSLMVTCITYELPESFLKLTVLLKESS